MLPPAAGRREFFGSDSVRFPGQYFDEENGLFYNYFRTYDPSVGRYMESDPLGLGGGLNTYAYIGNQPLTNVDEEGLQGGGARPPVFPRELHEALQNLPDPLTDGR